MTYRSFEPLDNSVCVEMSLQDLESLEVFLDFADAFLKKMDDEKLWPERDNILKMVNEVNAIQAKATELQNKYETENKES